MKTFEGILKTVRAHKKFLVSTHHNPDADAMASALVVALWLRKLGKSVVVVNEDACPSWLNFLPKAAMFKQASKISRVDHEAAIVVDCGDLSRIGGVSKLLSPGKPLVNIDHHVTNDRFGTVNAVIVGASSTCEIIFELLKEARQPLNKDMAALLYAGIMTDTGSFRFENTRPRTHAIVAELMAFGVSAPKMYSKLYVGVPVKDMKQFTLAIHQAQLLMDDQVYCVTLPKKGVQRFSKSFDLKEKLFTFLRLVDGIEVVVILTELSRKEVRVNLRSSGHVNVARLAQKFEGGGHAKAAGCRVHAPLAAARKKILAQIAKLIG